MVFNKSLIITAGHKVEYIKVPIDSFIKVKFAYSLAGRSGNSYSTVLMRLTASNARETEQNELDKEGFGFKLSQDNILEIYVGTKVLKEIETVGLTGVTNLAGSVAKNKLKTTDFFPF